MEQLDTIHRRLSPELRKMNEIIHQVLYTPNELMNRIVTSYLQTKGKQIRPVMVILSAKLFGEVNDDVLHTGAALEMLHNASLIHDDVVDETSLRRGTPTINAAWGNHIAVLVGDFFVSNALAAGIRTGNISIIAALSDLGRELSLGEIDQICNVRYHHLDEDSYFHAIRQKTASLFRNCAKMGAEAVGVAPEKYTPLVEYAEELGLCFQIKDDIFDYFPNPQIGKPTGNDLREGKVTLPLLLALRHAPAGEAEEARALLTGDTILENDIPHLIDFAIRNGGIDMAYDRMHEMRRNAAPLLDCYPDSEARRSLLDIFSFIIERDR